MSAYAMRLEPSAQWEPALRKGTHVLDVASNRVRDTATGRWVGVLVPNDGLAHLLSKLPVDPSQAKAWLKQARDLHPIAEALDLTGAIATVGALASVANLGVSMAGFAAVLHSLSRIESKLDEVLSEVHHVRQTVQRMHMEQSALSLARIHAAYECLERAASSDVLDQRNRLSERARDLFQESRLYYLHLWKALDPWRDPEISIPACLQMQSRYVVCANGEIDAEFLLEDPGAFRSAVGGIAAAMRDHMEMDPVRCFRARSDAACAKDHGTGVLFQADIEGLLKQIRLAFDVTRVTAQRLTARTDDADLPRDLGVSAVDVVRAARAAHEEGGADVFLARAAT